MKQHDGKSDFNWLLQLCTLEILGISFQLHIDAFSPTQEVSEFQLTVYDKSQGQTEVVKVTYKVITSHWRGAMHLITTATIL